MQGGSRPNFWGTLVLQLRNDRQMSQRQLADTAKINRTTLRRIEEGQSVGDIDSIERLLGVLGYELDAMALETAREAHESEQVKPAVAPVAISVHAAQPTPKPATPQLPSATNKSQSAMMQLMQFMPGIPMGSPTYN